MAPEDGHHTSTADLPLEHTLSPEEFIMDGHELVFMLSQATPRRVKTFAVETAGCQADSPCGFIMAQQI
jgi:hypothetical protein